MKLLILGGTVFVGRHLVETALEAGHEVTLFNRGQHNPGLFPEVEKLRGSRDGGLDALRGRRWDAVVDTCGYIPRIVRASAEMLADAVDHYTFISTVSVYGHPEGKRSDEDAEVGTLEDPAVEEVTGETYGPLKVLCEQAAEQAMPGRVLTIRPGLIVGPHDPTDRFTYWPHRVAQGGEVLAPGHPERPVEFIDVRDLAEWTLRMVEKRATGIFNATGPDYHLGMGRLLETCQDVSRSDARLVWVSTQFLEDAGVAPWMELPLWLGEDESAPGALLTVNVDRAVAAGLSFRPLESTIADTLAWAATRPADHQWRAGLKREREQELVHAWRAQQRAS